MIVGKNVRLRAITQTDVPQFVDWLNDPEVTAGLMIYLPMSTEMEQRWFNDLANRSPEEIPLAIEVREGEGWRHVGNCSFHNVDHLSQKAEVGIMIGDKAYWNRGAGTEAMRLLVQHGFDHLNLNRIYLKVYDTNPRAIRSYEKVGFVHEGVMRQDQFKNGRLLNVHLMSVLRDEWRARQTREE